MNPFAIPLSNPHADLETVGGKGMSLAKLARAGYPVPDGFHITTTAYKHFVETNKLQPAIMAALANVDLKKPTTLDAAAKTIHALFTGNKIPDEILDAIIPAYQSLSEALSEPFALVAVRSSATAEDLPDASFAGQQDTFLNIQGQDALIHAVQNCWASLWTGRAIAYRLRQGISSEQVALAVVVQEMVPAEAAGILFTANPLTSKRNETVINATWGLGEAIVSGVVTPDTLIVDKTSFTVFKKEIACKEMMTVRTPQGTREQPVPKHKQNKPVLSLRQAADLTAIGNRIEQLYQTPMDIEWTLLNGKFAILQARPITTLNEEPLDWKPNTPRGVYMRGSVIDLMPDPLSPLFASLGLPAIREQLYPVSREMTRSEPSFPDDYFSTINGYAYMNVHFSFKDWWWILFGMLPAYPRLLKILVPHYREHAHPEYQQIISDLKQQEPSMQQPSELWRASQTIVNAMGRYTASLMFATMGASAGSEGALTKIYNQFVRQEGDPPASTLLMGWDSLPMQSEKSLYDLATFCKQNESLADYVLQTASGTLMQQMSDQTPPAQIPAELWQSFCDQFNRHIERFGHMIFELDFAKPLPRDFPEPMLEVIKMYLQGSGTNPYERLQTNEEARIQTASETLQRVKGLKHWLYNKVLRWAQSLSEVREDALAEIGLGYPLLRILLQRIGEQFVQAGSLDQAGDIFWLEKTEIDAAVKALENQTFPQSFQDEVLERKAFHSKAKASAPPPILPPKNKVMGFDTKLFLAETEGNQSGANLKGVPTSPGQVTAPACLLHGPEDFDHMVPGGVLVATTTTPAWTPLFAMASAVVTDIGGPLSHGSIVAREYGIPAVMGTGVATRRISDGQSITVDGSQGTVSLN